MLLAQIDSSSFLCTYYPCYYSMILWKVIGNTLVYHSIQITNDLLGQMIIFQLQILVLHIPMIYVQPDQANRFHRGLLGKKVDIPLKNTSLL